MRERPVPMFFLALLIGAAVLVAMVVMPIIRELLLAVVLASVMRPIQDWLTKRLGGRPGLAAGLITVAVIIIVLGPLAMLVAVIIRDGADGVRFLLDTVHSQQVADIVGWLPESARDTVLDAIAGLPRNLEEAAGQVGAQGKTAGAAVTKSVVATGGVLYHGTLMLIALFFTLTAGDRIVTWLDSISPLAHGQTRELIATSKKVSFSIVVSTIATAAVQAVAALIGFYIAQVPAPIFFAFITFLAAFIPAIGAGAVCLVAALLLFLTGHPYMAIFLAVWGILVVGLVDNIIKPLLIKRGMEIHGGVVFFALLGGLAAFGAIGLLVGPLVVSMFLSLLSMYHRDYSPHKEHTPDVPGVPGTPDQTPDQTPEPPAPPAPATAT
ncbi:MAG: AI-2E family transporter [Myxococcota bacterium]|nr:AI-2E family transporter [Myxococcota bacterium]